jgi:hypothetical protein
MIHLALVGFTKYLIHFQMFPIGAAVASNNAIHVVLTSASGPAITVGPTDFQVGQTSAVAGVRIPINLTVPITLASTAACDLAISCYLGGAGNSVGVDQQIASAVGLV